MEINMPIKDAKIIIIYVLIVKPQNTYLISDDRLCPGDSFDLHIIQQVSNIMKMSCM